MMWLKLCFLLLYLLLLFVLARILESLAWLELGWPGLPSCSSHSCRLLDPVLLSVVQLKALLDQRGLSYEGMVEKSELTALVSTSGQVSIEEAEQSQIEDPIEVETNFTSGAHFIEQVEDAKDSVWLVQVSGNSVHSRGSHLGESKWKSLKRKMAKFGVRMGRLDCSLDVRYCRLKGWHSSFVLLALPSKHQKKANVAMYNFSGSPIRETALLQWVRARLDERIDRITDSDTLALHWQRVGKENSLEPEIRVVLLTTAETTPLFYSALSVKFPGRVKFGLVSLDSADANYSKWQGMLNHSKITQLPAYVVYTTEKNYTYGLSPGEHYSFASMERFFKSLYPCLNDVFIVSFILANVISWLEIFVSNCSIIKRFKKFTWCVFKYNLMVILLWLPVIGIFQMPYLDRFPLLALKCVRFLSLSNFGQILRGDYNFYLNHSSFLFFTLVIYVLILTVLCKKFRSQERDEDIDWFNFSQMQTLTHIRPNNLLEPMPVGRSDFLEGFDLFWSRFSQPSLWLPPAISPEYIQHLPTWKFNPVPLAARAQANVSAVQAALSRVRSAQLQAEDERNGNQACPTASQANTCLTCADQSQVYSGHPHQACNPSTHGISGTQNSAYGCGSSLSCVQPRVCPPKKLGTTELHDEGEGRPKNLSCEHTRDKMASEAGCVSGHRSQGMSSSKSYEGEQARPTSSVICPTCASRQDTPGLWNLQQSFACCTCSNVNPMQPEPTATSMTVPSENPSAGFSNHVMGGPSSPSQPPSVVNQSTRDPHTPASRGVFPPGYLESHQCVICLEDYMPLTSLCGLPCGHVFHETCIISWLNLDKHFCPMCRWPSYRPRPSHPI